MKKVLFVCSQNCLRSPTAENVFSDDPRVEALSAGTNHDAKTPLSANLPKCQESWLSVSSLIPACLKDKEMKADWRSLQKYPDPFPEWSIKQFQAAGLEMFIESLMS